MTDLTSNCFSRRGLLRAFAATAVVAAPTYANAFGLLRGAGDIRKVTLYSSRSGETANTIYWIEGEYIPEAWPRSAMSCATGATTRRGASTAARSTSWRPRIPMLETREPYMLLSGYRSPATNAMLRSRSRGVARNSLHMTGPGGRPSAEEPERRADGAGGGGLQRGRRRQVFPIELRAHGLRPGPRLGRLTVTVPVVSTGAHGRPFFVQPGTIR
jgi:uncharacterized protein YcbK (DUF882 family)